VGLGGEGAAPRLSSPLRGGRSGVAQARADRVGVMANAFARSLRKIMTDAERILWASLRDLKPAACIFAAKRHSILMSPISAATQLK